MIVFENLHLNDIRNDVVHILYTAIIEVAVAYTLQIIDPRDAPLIIAAVILSLEAVFSVINRAVIPGEKILLREIILIILIINGEII